MGLDEVASLLYLGPQRALVIGGTSLGGFLLTKLQARGTQCDGVDPVPSCRELNQGHVRSIEFDGWKLLIYPKLCGSEPSVYFEDEDNFCFSCGTLLFDDQETKFGLRRLFQKFQPGQTSLDSVEGHFCVGICKGGSFSLLTDPASIYKVYYDDQTSMISSSFLDVASLLDRRTVDRQALYEYAFQGATYGGATIFNEVRLLERGAAIRIRDGQTIVQTPDWTKPSIDDASFDEHVERNLRILRQVASKIIAGFGDNITCALSGGYDSRLLVALLREQGVVPMLHVYGADDDPDVKVAKQIANGEGWQLEHVDKHSAPRVTIDQFPSLISDNFSALDGYPNEGILDNGSNLKTRQSRTGIDLVYLNGGGGEIYRNFFYLRDRRHTITELVWSFYSQYDPSICTESFVEDRYLRRLEDKIKSSCNLESASLDRVTLDSIYPRFRCRFWMGRDVSANNHIGLALAPFALESVILAASSIPTDYKDNGRFARGLIRGLDERLASYPSIYGYNFRDPLPRSKVLMNKLNLAKPPWLRRYSYRVKSRLHRRPQRPYFLEDEYLDRLIDTEYPEMSQYFDLKKVRDLSLLSRIYTLEYLFKGLPEWVRD